MQFLVDLYDFKISFYLADDMIKPGATVIDVGITRIFDEKTGKSKLVGDVDYDNVKKVAGYITPVPGKLYN